MLDGPAGACAAGANGVGQAMASRAAVSRGDRRGGEGGATGDRGLQVEHPEDLVGLRGQVP